MAVSSDILSVIIATCNRPRLLAGCLDSLAKVEFDRQRFEVQVVDNASCDATRDVIQHEIGRNRMPLEYVCEARTGSGIARNTGVERARGGYLLFLDDDTVVSPGWLAAYDHHLRVEQRPVVQGRIIPRFSAPRPGWLGDQMLPRFGQVEQGEAAGPLRGGVHGGNLGVARRVFETVGKFRPDLGAGAAAPGEDTEFGRRAAAGGFPILYAPEPFVYHLIPRERLRRTAVLRRYYTSGLSQARFKEYPESVPRMLLYSVRFSLRKLAAAAFSADSAARMAALCDLFEHLGRVRQILRLRLNV